MSGLTLLLVAAVNLPQPTQAQPSIDPFGQGQNVLFRTKNYVAQVIWRRGIPYMTVSNNGWRVLSDVRAQVVAARGVADDWTTYSAVSGDYLAYVRVSPTGEAAIEVTLAGRRVREEYATLPPLRKRPTQTKPIQAKAAQPGRTIATFETLEYTVRVFEQQDSLFMNLYNKKTETIDLKQVPVVRVNTSNGIVYRHDGKSTIQAREDVKGQRTLLIIRDNAIQYRGEAF
ncbi:MAG: hypothetical protein NW224_22660 [Leptolyngbyaceae cyanobacterium bins.302]|nr:hypothetical protein [Leptolyngbyaceae cyanobacterium bins.302]